MSHGVVIIGAGLSGLVLAQGLKAHNVKFHIYEKRRDGIGKEGHRFRVNTSVIDQLKTFLPEELRNEFDRTVNDPNRWKPRYSDPHAIDFSDPVVDSEHATLPIDRTWIVSLLRKGLEDHITYEKPFIKYECRGDHVDVQFANGSIVQSDCLVGADGVHSLVRRRLQPHRRLLDLKKAIIWGRIPLNVEMRDAIDNEDVFSWMMLQDHQSNVQCVLEPITWERTPSSSKEDYIYFALGKDAPAGSSCILREEDSLTLCERHIQDASRSWHPTWRTLLGKTSLSHTRCAQVLSSKPDLELDTIEAGGMRVFIVGDAAHPMSPMGGSGATTAVKTTLDLVSLLASGDITEQSVQQHRQRVQEIAAVNIQHSFEGGKKFWRGKEWNEYSEEA